MAGLPHLSCIIREWLCLRIRSKESFSVQQRFSARKGLINKGIFRPHVRRNCQVKTPRGASSPRRASRANTSSIATGTTFRAAHLVELPRNTVEGAGLVATSKLLESDWRKTQISEPGTAATSVSDGKVDGSTSIVCNK